jgi:integrase
MAKPLATCTTVNGAIRIVLSGKLFSDRQQTSLFGGWRSDRAIDVAASEGLRDVILRDIAIGKFDVSLVRYGKVPAPERSRQLTTVADVWDHLLQHKHPPVLAESTYRSKYLGVYSVRLRSSGYLNDLISITVAIGIRDYLIASCNAIDAKQILINLHYGLELAIAQGLYAGKNVFFGLAKSITSKQSKIDFTSADKVVSGEKSKAYDAKESLAIINWFKKNKPAYYPFTLFRFLTGCRFGESIEIRWCDVSSDFKIVLFRRSFDSVNNLVKATKTGKSRKFNSSAQLAELLESLMLVAENPDPRELLFKNNFGGQITRSAYRSHWDECIADLIVKGELSHRLPIKNTRHTFESIAVGLGADRESVARQLGHTVAVQQKHYIEHPTETLPSLSDRSTPPLD